MITNGVLACIAPNFVQKETAEVDPIQWPLSGPLSGLLRKNPMISVWLSDLYLESSSNRSPD